MKTFTELYANDLTKAQAAHIVDNWSTGDQYSYAEKASEYWNNETATGSLMRWSMQSDLDIEHQQSDQSFDPSDPKYGIPDKDILAYQHVENEQQMYATMNEIKQLRKTAKMFKNAGVGWTATGMLPLEAADVIYWFPFFRAINLSRKARIGLFTTQQALIETTREGILQYNNPFRSFEQSAMNIILGTVFGSGLYSAYDLSVGKLVDVKPDIKKATENWVKDGAEEIIERQSVGAAAVNSVDSLNVNGIEKTDPFDNWSQYGEMIRGFDPSEVPPKFRKSSTEHLTVAEWNKLSDQQISIPELWRLEFLAHKLLGERWSKQISKQHLELVEKIDKTQAFQKSESSQLEGIRPQIYGLQAPVSFNRLLFVTPGGRLSSSVSLMARKIVDGLSRQHFLKQQHKAGIGSIKSVEDYVLEYDQVVERYLRQMDSSVKSLKQQLKSDSQTKQQWNQQLVSIGEDTKSVIPQTLQQLDSVVFHHAVNKTKSGIKQVDHLVSEYRNMVNQLLEDSRILNETQTSDMLPNIPRSYDQSLIQQHPEQFLSSIKDQLDVNLIVYKLRVLRELLTHKLDIKDLQVISPKLTTINQQPIMVDTIDSILKAYDETPTFDTIQTRLYMLDQDNPLRLAANDLYKVDGAVEQTSQVANKIYNDVVDFTRIGPTNLFDKNINQLFTSDLFKDLDFVYKKYTNKNSNTLLKNNIKISTQFSNTWLSKSASQQLISLIRNYSPLIGMQRVFGTTSRKKIKQLRIDDDYNILNNNDYGWLDPSDDLSQVLSKIYGLSHLQTQQKIKLLDWLPDNFKSKQTPQWINEQLTRKLVRWFEFNDTHKNNTQRIDEFKQSIEYGFKTDDFSKMINMLKQNPVFKTVFEQRQNDLDDIDHIINRLFGITDPSIRPNSTSYKITRVSRDIMRTAYLGGVLISSIPDLARPIKIAGLQPYVKHMAMSLLRGLRISKDDIGEIRTLAASGEKFMQSRMNALANVINEPGFASNTGKLWNRATQGLMTATGLPIYNQWLKTITGDLTLNTILKYASKSKLNTNETMQLGVWGIDVKDLPKLKYYIEKYGTKSDISENIFISPGIHKWTSENGEHYQLGGKLNMALSKSADSTINTPGASSLPKWMDNILGKFAGMFRSFISAVTDQTTLPGFQAWNQNYVTSLAWLTMMGVLVTVIKQGERNLSAGKDFTDQDWDSSDLMFTAVDRSGIFALFMELNNVMDKLSGRTISVQTLTGMQEPQRFVTRGPVETLVGPVAGQLDALRIVFKGLSNMAGADVPLSDSEINKLINNIPGSRLPYIRPTITNPTVDYLQSLNEEQP